MTHGIGYMGHFDLNFEKLEPGFSKYERRDGAYVDVATPPAKVDGAFFGYMVCTGSRFVAVRVQFEDEDVCLKNPVELIPERHTDGKRFAPVPASISDGAASRLLEDSIQANPDQMPVLSDIARRLGFG